jgi:hypothetical protein
MVSSWGAVTFRDFLPLASLGIALITDPIHEPDPAMRTLKIASTGAALTAAVYQFGSSVHETFQMRNEPLAYAAIAARTFSNFRANSSTE